jgi:hypothetical protein
MVLAFLRAERRGLNAPWVENAVAADPGLLDNPQVDDEAENARRGDALRFRGYKAGSGEKAYLFEGFPTDVEWWEGLLSREDIEDLSYGRGRWSEVTAAHGRQVRNVAPLVHKLASPTRKTVAAIEEAIRAGKDLEPLIVCSTGPEARHVLLEGYKRATAYARVLQPDTEIGALIGHSGAMESWLFF